MTDKPETTTRIAELEEALRFADVQNKELSKKLRDALVARDTYKLSLENLLTTSTGMQVGNRKSVQGQRESDTHHSGLFWLFQAGMSPINGRVRWEVVYGIKYS